MNNEPIDLDYLDISFVIALVTILTVTVLSILFARYKKEDSLKNFKKTKKLLESFEIRSNLTELLKKSDNVSEQITKLQALKVLTMFLLVIAQTYRQITSMPFVNPSFIEKVN